MAAELSNSSIGCDFWALKTALRSQQAGACFAAFVANIWSQPIHINVTYDGQILKNFIYIPQGQGAALTYEPYDPAQGLGVGQVAVLFLSRSSSGAGLIDCPMPAALDLETGSLGTAKGHGFHIATDYPAVAYQILPYGGALTGGTSATLLFPTSAWDTAYVAINAYRAVPDPSPPAEPFRKWPSLDILAHQDTQPGFRVDARRVHARSWLFARAGRIEVVTRAFHPLGEILRSTIALIDQPRSCVH